MDVDRFTTSLFEARDYYQNIIDHALSQLEHINALLEDVGSKHTLNSPTSRLQLNINARSLSESSEELPQSHTNNGILTNLSVTTDFEELTPNSEKTGIHLNEGKDDFVPAGQAKTDLPSLSQSQTSSIEDRESITALAASKTTNTANKESEKTDSPNDSILESKTKQEVNQKKTQKQSKVSESQKKSSSSVRNKRLPQRPRPVNIPFIPKLDGLKLGDAILVILKENPETVSHTDYIVRAIYGELDNNALRIAKDRVTKELSRGYILGRWYRLPDTPGYYTVSKHLTESRNSHQ